MYIKEFFINITNFCLKLIAYSILFFINTIILIKIKFSRSWYLSKSFIKSAFYQIIYFGEEELIKKNLSIIEKNPEHIGILITNSSNFNLMKLTKMISWILYSEKIKHLSLYDPFFKISNPEELKNLISLIFKDRVNLNAENLIINNKDENNIKKIEKDEDMININDENNLEFNNKEENIKLNIRIMNYKQCNTELVDSFVNNSISHKFFSKLPNIISKDFIKQEYENEFKKSNLDNFSKFYTLKKEDYLVDILLIPSNDYINSRSSFGNFNSNICLYGFPFTMIENSEIIKINDFENMNVTEFIDIFYNYNKIDQRFGK